MAGIADARSKTGITSDAQSVLRYPTRASELDHRRLQPRLLPCASVVENLRKYGAIAFGLPLENGHQTIRRDFRLPTNICHADRSEGDIGEARHSAPYDGIAGWRITRAGEIAAEACHFGEIMG